MVWELPDRKNTKSQYWITVVSYGVPLGAILSPFECNFITLHGESLGLPNDEGKEGVANETRLKHIDGAAMQNLTGNRNTCRKDAQ